VSNNEHKGTTDMNKLRYGIPLLVSALSALSGASNAATEEAKETKGVKAFRACYESSIPQGMVGAPTQKIEVVVDEQPKRKATGKAKVTWGSVGPSFKPIECKISGPWYFMCTMTSCSIRYDYTCAKGVKGMLVAPNWGAPGKFVYTFPGGSGTVEQDAAVCN
jgi:hypothetical protein